jgi:murein DD-endopeptidase MepM/ murein hydrolase activator NlpD
MTRIVRLVIITLIFGSFSLSSFAQKILPQNYFISPLDTLLQLTGAFGELRLNHFHSGVDFRTHEREGLPVHAAADGKIVRIKVSPFGFGRALYIDHPNGFTTVYGHLQKFSPELENYIRKEQYKQQSFDVDVFPSQTIAVKKGDIIAFSGNSGASFGPHLHFEVRDTKTERPINPLYFGFPVTDTLSPFINFFLAYPVGKSSIVDDTAAPTRFAVKKDSMGIYHLKSNDTLRVFGKASFGVQAFDYFYNRRDQNGYYSFALYDNSNIIFHYEADSFAFDESRYINACLDYKSYYLKGYRVLQTNRLANNRFSLYNRKNGPGVISFTNGQLHQLELIVSDFGGNQARLELYAKGYIPADIHMVPDTTISKFDTIINFSFKRMNTFKTPEITVEIPGDALYDTLAFGYSCYPRIKRSYSALHLIQSPLTPLQQRITVSIKADSLPERLRDKALLVRIADGKRNPSDATWKNGYVTGKTWYFGYYTIGVDTIPPKITAVPLPHRPRSRKHHHHPLPKRTKVSFIITDNFSGIDSYKATINGKWALMEYDAKNDLFTYNYDNLLLPGKNSFRLTVTDAKGNKASYFKTIMR